MRHGVCNNNLDNIVNMQEHAGQGVRRESRVRGEGVQGGEA